MAECGPLPTGYPVSLGAGLDSLVPGPVSPLYPVPPGRLLNLGPCLCNHFDSRLKVLKGVQSAYPNKAPEPLADEGGSHAHRQLALQLSCLRFFLEKWLCTRRGLTTVSCASIPTALRGARPRISLRFVALRLGG